MLTLSFHRCENVTFLSPLLRLSLSAALRLTTGKESTCNLATHLHLNDYNTDCVLCVSVCARVYLHLLFICRQQCQGFLVPVPGTSADLCQTSEFVQMTF